MGDTTTSYLQGRPVEGHHAHHHVMPLKTYLAVFGALMVLTVITVLVSFMDLGAASIYVAMAVALVKAGFVVGYFMHLKYDDKFHAFIFFSTLIFIVIFFAFTLIDLGTRDAMQAEWDNRTYFEEKFQGLPDPPAGHGHAADHAEGEAH